MPSDWSVRLSMMAAVGSGGRPEAIRSTTPKIVRQRLETARGQPSLGLLIDRGPRRQIVWHGTLGDPVTNDVA